MPISVWLAVTVRCFAWKSTENVSCNIYWTRQSYALFQTEAVDFGEIDNDFMFISEFVCFFVFSPGEIKFQVNR